jgi:hypothetical protein
LRLLAKSPETQATQSADTPIVRRACTQAAGSDHPLLQLQKTHGNQFVQRLVERAQAEEDKDKDKLPGSAATAINRSRGIGRALDNGTKAQMEAGFSTDFSSVRVHDDSESHALSRSLNARAFTTGQDVYFGAGQYQPGSQDGQRLIAHELAHTVQQPSAVDLKAGDALSVPGEPAEQEADHAAAHVTDKHG